MTFDHKDHKALNQSIDKPIQQYKAHINNIIVTLQKSRECTKFSFCTLKKNLAMFRRLFSHKPKAFLAKTAKTAVQKNSNLYYSSESRNDAIGFIGLGQMGFKMANNLYQKINSPLVIYDINKTAMENFTFLHKSTLSQKPILHANSPTEVAQKASTVITMLPSSPHVKKVYIEEPDSLINGIDENSFLIDSSTIDQCVSKQVSKKIIDKGARAVDAPVSGGVGGAEAATLTFMVGASTSEDFKRAIPYLSYMGKNIIHCGELGTGQIAKICNNMLLAISMVGVAETMNLGVQLGMDPKLLANILNTSSGRCWSSDTYNPHPGILPNVPSSKNYEGGFSNILMAKDMRLAVKAANESNSTVILGAIAQQLYNQLSKTVGFEKKDFSSIYRWLSEN